MPRPQAQPALSRRRMLGWATAGAATAANAAGLALAAWPSGPVAAQASAAGYTPSPTAPPAPPAPTAPPELAGLWPQARLQGQASFRFLGIPIYEVALWAPQPIGPANSAQQPLALVLVYRRSLSGERIAERSLSEMARAGPIAEAKATRWLAAMRRLFPDVDTGQRLTGVQLPGQGARFFYQGQARGELLEAEFAQRFFGIWLAEHSSAPELRRQLLGLA
jgi:hypothetical protein